MNDELQHEGREAEPDSPQAAPQVDETKDTTTPKVSEKSPWWRKRWFIIAVVVVLVLAITGSIWLLHNRHHKTASTVVTKSATAKQPATKQLTIGDVTFYDTPKQLADLGFFRDLVGMFGTSCTGDQTTDCPPTITANEITYVQIGTTTTGQAVIIASAHKGMDVDFDYVVLGTGGNNYTILGKLSFPETDPTYADQLALLKKSLSSNVTVDTTATIAALTFPSQVTVAGETLVLPGGDSYPPGYLIKSLSDIRGSYFNSPVATSDMKKIAVQNGVTYYEITVPGIGDANYQVKEFYGVIDNIFAATYKVQEPLASDTAPAVSWQVGNKASTATYTYSAGGCGSPTGFVVGQNLKPDELTAAGNGSNGMTVYQLNTTSALFNDYYTDYGDGSGLQDASLQNLKPDQFQAAHGLVFVKNALGEYVAYQRTDMVQGAGCGKPVIYLYPQKTTNVNVSVGANVQQSNPLYTSSGWQNVLAQPNGQLSYQGKSYNSLYWEGTGLGPYPLITSGTVVPRAKVVATIKQQLQQQGLNTQEISDFLAYWQPRLPTTPYTRLTWLDTNQMNTLAPLQITPKPTTVIRVFLDFQGLETARTIAPQSFRAPARKGLTVVEWGGLLHQTN